MTNGSRRWGVALLAGGMLAAAGCGEQASSGGRHAATPTHEKFGAGRAEGREAEPLESGGGSNLVAPSDGAFRAMGPGAIPQLFVEGLGTSLEESYRGPPEGTTATGGAGSAGGAGSEEGAPRGGEAGSEGTGSAGSGGSSNEEGRK
ncbi:hypothetical protein ACLESO_52340 [Pyxidicoccus sp. 3LG]